MLAAPLWTLAVQRLKVEARRGCARTPSSLPMLLESGMEWRLVKYGWVCPVNTGGETRIVSVTLDFSKSST